MIERKFVKENKKEYLVEEFIRNNLKGIGHSMTKVKKTPLGEKIIVYSSRPGLVVGRGGSNIKKLTKELRAEFQFENPQIEIAEVDNLNLDPQIVAERIANSLERFGSKKFKGIMHKTMTDVMRAGAKGVEILLSGKIPSSRAKTWRVYDGYLKKCGDIAVSGVKSAQMQALLKTGIVGIKVKIMPPDLVLPDTITVAEITEEPVMEEPVIEEIEHVDVIEEKVKPAKTSRKPKTHKKVKETVEVTNKETVEETTKEANNEAVEDVKESSEDMEINNAEVQDEESKE